MSATKVHSDAQQEIEKLKVESRKLKIDTEKVKKQIEELKVLEAKWKIAAENSRENENKLKEEEENLRRMITNTERTIKFNEENWAYEEMEMKKKIEKMMDESEQWKKMYEERGGNIEGDIQYDLEGLTDYVKKGGQHFIQALSFRDKFIEISTDEKEKKKVEREFKNFKFDMDLMLKKLKENTRRILESDDEDGFLEMKPFPVPFSETSVARMKKYEDGDKSDDEVQELVRLTIVTPVASEPVVRAPIVRPLVEKKQCYGGIEQQSNECYICIQPIYTTFELHACRMCNTHSHIACFHRAATNKRCPLCRFPIG